MGKSHSAAEAREQRRDLDTEGHKELQELKVLGVRRLRNGSLAGMARVDVVGDAAVGEDIATGA